MVLGYFIQIVFFNVLGCASQTQVFDFGLDQKKDVETSSGIDLSIRWVEVDGDSVTVSLDSQPDGYERTLWIESDSSKEEYRPESDIFEINLEDGEYVFGQNTLVKATTCMVNIVRYNNTLEAIV